MPTIVCPSGLTGEVRRIKGHELVMIARQAEAKEVDQGFASIINGCWESTTDAGPYGFVANGDAKPDWNRVLKGDILYTYVFLRMISHPEKEQYDLDLRCENCNKRLEQRFDLSLLPKKVLSKEATEIYKSGRSFSTKIGDTAVAFALQTPSQEDEITRFMKREKRKKLTLVEMLAAQIKGLNGATVDYRRAWQFVADLDMDELAALRDALAEPDCGLEMEVHVDCTDDNCGWDMTFDLPLGKTFFALPRRAKKGAAGMPSSSETSSESAEPNGSGSGAPISGGASTEEAASAV